MLGECFYCLQNMIGDYCARSVLLLTEKSDQVTQPQSRIIQHIQVQGENFNFSYLFAKNENNMVTPYVYFQAGHQFFRTKILHEQCEHTRRILLAYHGRIYFRIKWLEIMLSHPQRQHNTTSTLQFGWTRKWLCTTPSPPNHQWCILVSQVPENFSSQKISRIFTVLCQNLTNFP